MPDMREYCGYCGKMTSGNVVKCGKFKIKHGVKVKRANPQLGFKCRCGKVS